MSVLQLQATCAFLFSVALLVQISRHAKNGLSARNIGYLFVVFMAASSLPVGVVLCSCALFREWEDLGARVDDEHALYVSAAGAMLLISSYITISGVFKKWAGTRRSTQSSDDTISKTGGQAARLQSATKRTRVTSKTTDMVADGYGKNVRPTGTDE